ncbi:hypothetical protein BRYFOR_05117 [Marvinbryantia formatexigens DSM 14469]|uniref:Uncharacterized protein n=1 Tax=Marvinbryantia formatexigens DSM 14469 TaxID=478749 RepID=C6L927_9FIRM|nr:hypothetical protein BRYFOR_05117 [Marvinbryantia formatexigens DSM 14469]
MHHIISAKRNNLNGHPHTNSLFSVKTMHYIKLNYIRNAKGRQR